MRVASGRCNGLWHRIGPPLLGLAAALCAATAVRADGVPAPAQQLREALRLQGGEAPRPVQLPDLLRSGDAKTVLAPIYRLRADVGATPGLTAIYLPGVFAHARVSVNGSIVADRIVDPAAPRPRGPERMLLATVPAEVLRPGSNDIEVALAAVGTTSLSTVWIGAEPQVRAMYDSKLRQKILGPTVAAAVMFALALCVLVLWARRPADTIYAYFGIGGALWALHTVWTVLPDPLLGPPHRDIWWTMGYPLFVAPLIVFCLRLAQWRMPRFERSMWAGIAIGPPLLYGAHAAGVLEPALAYWRLAWIGAVAVGVYAVGRYALRRRDAQGALLLGTGALCFVFALRDWLLDYEGLDNNPVFLTDYAGLWFFPLVAWILIDGFVQATRQLERLNAELERRVASKSAQLQQALDDMRAAKDTAESANRAKSTFLAAASHDLRQPMHALGLYMAALRGEHVSAPQDELVQRMSASIGAMETMFDALLDVSRIDAGAVVPSPRPFALEPMLHRLAEEFARLAAEKGLRMSVRVAPAARRLNAFSDPLLIERIVRNLLGNAVKYTPAGGVLLACRLRGGDSGHWQIEVWDTGPGIPQAERERVFDEFYQLGNPERDRAGGLGLGLSIVRRLARLLQHPVRLHSAPGRGSRFVLELQATARAAPRAAVQPVQTGSLRGLGVAVVDDDPDVRDAMQALLERWGCDVVSGASADEVLRRAGPHARQRLQVLVVDFQLSEGRTGIEAIAALRAVCGAATPALVVSGASAPERLAELQASGFEWLIKPVAPARLRSWLIFASRWAVCGGQETPQAARGAVLARAPG